MASGRDWIVWGGQAGAGPNLVDGARFSGTGGAWEAIPNAPLVPREFATVAANERHLLVWGGWCRQGQSFAAADGALYDRADRRWTVAPRGPLAGRVEAVAAWTGADFLIFGGRSTPEERTALWFFDGARYDPTGAEWREISRCPLRKRFDPRLVAASGRLLVFGGYEDRSLSMHGTDVRAEQRSIAAPVEPQTEQNPIRDGAIYEYATDRWTHIECPSALANCQLHADGDDLVCYEPATGRVARWRPGTDRVFEDELAGEGELAELLQTTSTMSEGILVVLDQRQGSRIRAWSFDRRSWSRLPIAPLHGRSGMSITSGPGGVFFWGGIETHDGASSSFSRSGALLTLSRKGD